ncbi:MAG: citramalate synthase [Clostridia bacterium]|nr:citramalate synthase [Clostridia bacterium]
MNLIKIYDTTLRDGTQGEGIAFSAEDKVKIALRLDQLGVHYIEGGWPGSNPKDLEFFRRIQDHRLNTAKVSAFGSTRRPGIAVEDDPNLKALLEAGTPVCTIFGKTWDFHVEKALQTTLEENLAMIRESVAYLKAQGREVVYDAEHFFDGFKANPAYALETLKAAQAGGASTLVLCDTNGGSMPWEIFNIIEQVKAGVSIPLGIHAHNDGELAVANSITAVQAGATHVQGTVNGFGERCGNANLCSIIPNLVFKMGHQGIDKELLQGLTEFSRYVSELANIHPFAHQPFVGKSAFAHKGGVHVSALLKNPATYEHMEPELVGNQRRVLVSELSGVSNLVYKAGELGFDINHTNPETRKILEEIKTLEFEGFQFEGAEGSFELLMRRAFEEYQDPFCLEAFRVINEKREGNSVHSEVVIKLQVGSEVVHTAAEGNGPVHALDNALRKALEGAYPEIKNMKLTDYKVRVLQEKDGTAARVRVLIESSDGHNSWGTVGVSENIIEASWQALADSVAYGLLKAGRKH